MFWFLGCETCGISAPHPGIKLPALEDEGLTTGPPRKTAVSGPFVSLCLFLSVSLSSFSHSLFLAFILPHILYPQRISVELRSLNPTGQMVREPPGVTERPALGQPGAGPGQESRA